MNEVRILRYCGGSDEIVASFILDVQRSDVGVFVPIDEQPDLLDIARAFKNGSFWLAKDGETLVGTVGIVQYGRTGVLKRLFVDARYRGANGIARPLLQCCLSWARERRLTQIVLDTPAAARRSHSFYRRQGFHLADRSALPCDYVFPDRDSLIFRRDLG